MFGSKQARRRACFAIAAEEIELDSSLLMLLLVNLFSVLSCLGLGLIVGMTIPRGVTSSAWNAVHAVGMQLSPWHLA